MPPLLLSRFYVVFRGEGGGGELIGMSYLPAVTICKVTLDTRSVYCLNGAVLRVLYPQD